MRLANRGYSADAIFRAIAKKPKGRRDPTSMKYMRVLDDKGKDAADDYARTTARKAIAFVAANPRIIDKADALVRITEIKATADAMPWGVYAGPRTRRALEGAFVVAERVGGVAFGFAPWEWAEICGLDLRALQSERDRLVRFDWLRRNPGDRPGRTARYALRVPPYIHSDLRSECTAPDGRAWLAHDAFRPEGLGDSGWYLLGLVGTDPVQDRELGLRSGLDPPDLGDLVAALERFDLVEVASAGVVRVPDPMPALDRVAELRGTLGRAAEDRRRHEAEREGFRSRDVMYGPWREPDDRGPDHRSDRVLVR